MNGKKICIVENNAGEREKIRQAIDRAGIEDALIINIRTATNNFSDKMKALLKDKRMKFVYGGNEENFQNALRSFGLNEDRLRYIGKYFNTSVFLRLYWNSNLSHAL